MGPLSAKQHREYLKFAAKEKRESDKQENEESRKEELHELKLMAEANKTNQALGHKENEHKAKMSEHGGPLSAGMLVGNVGIEPVNPDPLTFTTRQGHGSQLTRGQGYANGGPVMGNPLSGRPHVGGKPLGRHPVQPTDVVPAMLTPGEAVIPRAAAQDPRNKPIINQMVQQGRAQQGMPSQGFANGGMVPQGNPVGASGLTGRVQLQNQLAIMPNVGPKKHKMGFADGTTEVPVTAPVNESYMDKLKRVFSPAPSMVTLPEFGGMLGQAKEALKTRTKKIDDNIDKQVNGYADGGYVQGYAAGDQSVSAASEAGDVDWNAINQKLNGGVPQTAYTRPQLQTEVPVVYTQPQGVTVTAPLASGLTEGQTMSRESGGNVLAKNPKSTAFGLYQMTDAAWKDAEGIDKTLIGANHTDASVQKKAYDAYRGNALPNQLKALNYIPDNDSLGKAYIVGASGYDKIAKAPDNTPLDKILPSWVMEKNPNLVGKTSTEFLYGKDPYSIKTGSLKEATLAERRSGMTHTGKGVPPIDNVIQQGANAAATEPTPELATNLGIPDSGTFASTKPNMDGLPSNEVPPPAGSISAADQNNFDSFISSFTKDNQDALQDAEKKAATVPPEQKKSFWEGVLGDLYGGKDSIFNQKDLIRFIGGAAFRAATGDNINRALRGASIDTINTSDKRHQTEIQFENQKDIQMGTAKMWENRDDVRIKAAQEGAAAAERKAMYGKYTPESIHTYNVATKSDPNGDYMHLLEPVKKGYKGMSTPEDVTFSSGPLRGVLIKKTVGQDDEGNHQIFYNGIPESEFYKRLSSGKDDSFKTGLMNTPMVTWNDDKHGPQAVAKNYNALAPTWSKSAEEEYSEIAKGRDGTGHAGLPTPTAFSNSAISFYKSRGYDPTDANQNLAMHAINTIALKDMVADKKQGRTVEDPSVYLAKSMLIADSGINKDAFSVGNKSMNPGLIKNLEDKLNAQIIKENNGKPLEVSEITKLRSDKLKKMYSTWSNPDTASRMPSGSATTSGFYQYVDQQLGSK
jgi:hypothetical protein